MRLRFALFLCTLIALAAPLFAAEDVFLSIGGSVGAFHTDMRLFNPSYTKDIQVTAYLLALNTDNTGAQTKPITVPKRTMLVYNDVLSSLFGVSGLGGLRLKSDDEFVATQRIYALAADVDRAGGQVLGQSGGRRLDRRVGQFRVGPAAFRVFVDRRQLAVGRRNAHSRVRGHGRGAATAAAAKHVHARRDAAAGKDHH